jgi:hypothetical protein
MDSKPFKHHTSNNLIFFDEELNQKKKIVFGRLQREILKQEVLADKEIFEVIYTIILDNFITFEHYT